MPDSRKLVFLDESRRRSPVRRPRTGQPVEEPRPSGPEQMWLARGLFAAAAFLAFSWLTSSSNGAAAIGEGLAYAFAVALSLLGGHGLRSSRPERVLLPLLAAGALLFVGIENLTAGVLSALEHELSLAERFGVLAASVAITVGAWTVSHTLRTHA